MGARALRGAAAGAARTSALAPTAAPAQRALVQRVRKVSDIFDEVDKIRTGGTKVAASEVHRLLFWNEKGTFDNAGGAKLVPMLKQYMAVKTDLEKAVVDEGALPEFMRLRNEFSATLPDVLGGGTLWFRKRPERAMMQADGGWISDNAYWRSPAKVRYMIHAILGFQGGADKEPNPHVTLRNAETQVAIDLDISNPLPPTAQVQKPKRILADMEVTRSSYSRGLGGKRDPGANMKEDDAAFGHLNGETVKNWLGTLKAKAQGALKAAG
ncbi:MAG TPA: hypothetical protein VGC56_17645 [Allosphingosinicella sp.]|jgi:hypothetical protein